MKTHRKFTNIEINDLTTTQELIIQHTNLKQTVSNLKNRTKTVLDNYDIESNKQQYKKSYTKIFLVNLKKIDTTQYIFVDDIQNPKLYLEFGNTYLFLFDHSYLSNSYVHDQFFKKEKETDIDIYVKVYGSMIELEIPHPDVNVNQISQLYYGDNNYKGSNIFISNNNIEYFEKYDFHLFSPSPNSTTKQEMLIHFTIPTYVQLSNIKKIIFSLEDDEQKKSFSQNIEKEAERNIYVTIQLGICGVYNAKLEIEMENSVSYQILNENIKIEKNVK